MFVSRTGLSVRLGGVSPNDGRLKMQGLYVAGIWTECLLRRGVRLWEVKNAAILVFQGE